MPLAALRQRTISGWPVHCVTLTKECGLGIDPENGERVSLFNPRRQVWREHFGWSEDGVFIVGRTACGRATVVALQLNHEHLVKARRRWVMVGWHPPQGGDAGF